jgi:hypothetical protein
VCRQTIPLPPLPCPPPPTPIPCSAPPHPPHPHTCLLPLPASRPTRVVQSPCHCRGGMFTVSLVSLGKLTGAVLPCVSRVLLCARAPAAALLRHLRRPQPAVHERRAGNEAGSPAGACVCSGTQGPCSVFCVCGWVRVRVCVCPRGGGGGGGDWQRVWLPIPATKVTARPSCWRALPPREGWESRRRGLHRRVCVWLRWPSSARVPRGSRRPVPMFVYLCETVCVRGAVMRGVVWRRSWLRSMSPTRSCSRRRAWQRTSSPW